MPAFVRALFIKSSTNVELSYYMKKIEKNGKYVKWHLMKNRSSAVLSPNVVRNLERYCESTAKKE